MDYTNTTSEKICWMGDENVPLPDLNTQNPTVIQRYGEWIQALVKEYNIDGLRIDGGLFALSHIEALIWSSQPQSRLYTQLLKYKIR